MENMASTWATALFNVAPAGEAALQPCPWAGVFLGGSPEGGLCAGGEPSPAPRSKAWAQSCGPVLLTQSPEIDEVSEVCAGAPYSWARGAEVDEWEEQLSRQE